MKPTDFWKILMQRKSILSSPTLFQRCCCWQLRVSLLPSYQGSPPLLWIGLPQGAPSPGHPGWKKNIIIIIKANPGLEHHIWSWSSPGWCLSSPPRLCPPWQPLPPASTLRLVRISQRVHVMIVAGDWNIGHRGLARWTNPAAGRPRVLGSQQSHHALGIHSLRTSKKYDETIFGRILPIQQLEAELEQFDGLEPSLALGGGQTLWGRTICWSFENTTKQQQRVLKCIAQWCFLDALAYLRSHVKKFCTDNL